MQNTSANRSRSAALWYVKNADRVAFGILALWCLLPVAMSAYDFIMCALGKFPSDVEILEAGLKVGYINYNMAIDAYYLMFRVLGFVTLAYALFTIAVCRERVFCRESVRAMPWFYFLLGLLGCTILSTLLSDDPLRAFTGGKYFHDGLLSYFIYGGVFACASMIREERHRLWLLRLYCAVTAYLAIIMIVQKFSDSDYLNHCFPSFRAVVFNQFNHFGYVLCMGIMATAGLYLYDRRAGAALRGANLAGFALLVYGVLLNDTFGAYLASLVALPIAYVLYRRAGNRLTLAALLPGILFILLSVMNCLGLTPGARTLLANLSQFGIDIKNIATGAEEAAYAGTGRMTLWGDTIQRIGQRPIFGFGPEGFYGKNAITNNDRPHDEYLLIAAYHGIPALVMYLGALFTLARHHWKNIRRLSPMILAVSGATLGYLASSCFGNPVFNTVPFFWMYLGLTTGDGTREPLLCCDPTVTIIPASTSKAKKRFYILVGLIAVSLSVFFIIISYITLKTEFSYEMADLQCMRSAETTAKLYLRNKTIDINAEYWFDANDFTLIPTDEDKPLPYGSGTMHSGGAVASFKKEYGYEYPYNEQKEYGEMLIKVSIYKEELNRLDVYLEWVK